MAGRCAILKVALLLLTAVKPIVTQSKTTSGSVVPAVKKPEGCTLGTEDGPPPNKLLWCRITPTNINAVLHAMKQPHFSTISIGFLQLQFANETFHPNLKNLGITGDLFSIAPGTFNGLSKLKMLFLIKLLNSDSTLYKQRISRTIDEYGINSTAYPLSLNLTLPVFGSGWLTPLANLQWLKITQSNISSFTIEEFCTLNHLKRLDLSGDRINSTKGLGISCNSPSCIPCLPNVTHLNISDNPISDFTLNISRDLPRLDLFDISYCKLSVLYFNDATSDRIEQLAVNDNKLHSILINEHPCYRPYLKKLWLQNNQLRTISPGLFTCMPHLQYLDLSKNALTAEMLISAGLNNLTELKRLILKYNNIKILQPALIGNMVQLLRFWCDSCNLTTIEHGTFTHLENLEYLILRNNRLTMIKDGALSHFSRLKVLDLSGNALRVINLTENLRSLSAIGLNWNQLSELPTFPGKWVNLIYLTINRNQITQIGPEQISGLTNLTYFSLAFNNIENITDYTFKKQHMLEKLILSSNRIKSISEFGLDRLPSLTHLSLDDNSLMELPPLHFLTIRKIKYLNVSRNMIKSISFHPEMTLRVIDLSHNHISQIKSSLSSFDQLQFVDYSYNHLITLNMTSFVTETLPRPRVYLQGNPLHIDCHSEWLLDTKLEKTWNEINQDREERYGRTQILTNYSDPIDKEDPYTGRIINGTRIYLVKIGDWDLLYCTTATGKNKSFTELSRADFVCQYAVLCDRIDCSIACCKDIYGCPCSTFCYPMCTCYHNNINDSINLMNCTSRNITSLPSRGPSHVRSITMDDNYLTLINSSSLDFPHLLELNAANSHISYLQPQAFKNLKELRRLNLEYNNIEVISKHLFAFLINLQELYLQGNKIHQIDNGSFDNLLQLKVLWMHGNNFKILHFSLFERMFSLTELTLNDNPWICDCQSGPVFKEWLIYSDIIVNHTQIYCDNIIPLDTANDTENDSIQNDMTNKSGSTSSLHRQAVLDIDFSICSNRSIIERVYHHSIHTKSTAEVAALAAAVTVLAIFALVIYNNCLLLRVWLYNKYGIRFHRDDEDDKPYDLFIACSKTDERLVINELLPELEDGAVSYRVCLKCRDWHPCASTTDSVVASVQLSKRTIVLVSANHLDTQWCEYSFDAAHYQVLKDKQMRLILVLTDLKLEARMTRAMKLYMKTNAFLVIGEKWFWKKLRYYLADNPSGADHVVNREFSLMNPY